MLSNKSPSHRRRTTGLVLAGALVIAGLALTASGESMAAQVGAKVSDALPISRVRDVLPSLQTVAALPALPPAHAVDKDKGKSKTERREEKVIVISSSDGDAAMPVPPAPPVPPVPPAPGVAPTPPVPPLPPLPPMASSGKHDYHVVRRVYRDGKLITDESLPPELIAVPRIEMTESCDGKGMVSRSEETVTKDGKTQNITRIRICKREIAEQVRAADGQRRLALVEMRNARAMRSATCARPARSWRATGTCPSRSAPTSLPISIAPSARLEADKKDK